MYPAFETRPPTMAALQPPSTVIHSSHDDVAIINSSNKGGDIIESEDQEDSRIDFFAAAPIVIPDDDGDEIGILDARPALVQAPEDPYINYDEVWHGGRLYRLNHDVEFWDGSFLRIHSIRRKFTHGGRGEFYLYGPKFERCRKQMGFLPPKQNEIAMVSPAEEESLHRVRRRRFIILTNLMYPDCRHIIPESPDVTENECRLVCRWKTSLYENAKRSLAASYPVYWGRLERLREEEADNAYRIPDHALRHQWRGDGDCLSQDASGGQKRKYTFGDAFCGAGGMSWGAHMAGFVNRWGFDRNQEAIETYRRRYPDAEVWQASVHDFLALIVGKECQVDVLHLSPPCQPHSPAHTVAGQYDEENEAASLCITDCLKKIKPRYATLEQTFGILNRDHWFRAVVSEFTSAGYSVQWRVLHCVQFGVPQTRQRLFIMAACPGERLPEFPKPIYRNPKRTDGSENHLKPPRTLRDAIGHLISGMSLHNPDDSNLQFSEGPRATKQLMDEPFYHTIMAGGSNNNIHPSMQRRFTLREIACIQTFPMDYKFVGSCTAQKRLIGNAVPPIMGKALLRQVMKALLESDRRPPPPPVMPVAIAIDDDAGTDDIIFVGQAEAPPDEAVRWESSSRSRSSSRAPPGEWGELVVVDEEEEGGSPDTDVEMWEEPRGSAEVDVWEEPRGSAEVEVWEEGSEMEVWEDEIEMWQPSNGFEPGDPILID